jgi:hypothetical protein
MRILALDLGKYKTVACDYESESGVCDCGDHAQSAARFDRGSSARSSDDRNDEQLAGQLERQASLNFA